MKSFFLLLCMITVILYSEEYNFEGRHFIANYCKCDPVAISDVTTLQKVMNQAIQASGATILGSSFHCFPPDGLTLVVLLSESHASIHTYPEHCSCFIDLFTCGSRCSEKEFDRILREYLKPQEVEEKLLLRNQGIRDLSK